MTRETAPATRADVQFVAFVGSTTGTCLWALNRFVFRGDIPIEVAGMVQYGVPLGLTALAAEYRWRRRRCEAQQEE